VADYRLLKGHNLITSPAFIVIKVANEFYHSTMASTQTRQTDFICPKMIGWGWYSLSTLLDDISRFIIAEPEVRHRRVPSDPSRRMGLVDHSELLRA
jgi:hypothetical protein